MHSAESLPPGTFFSGNCRIQYAAHVFFTYMTLSAETVYRYITDPTGVQTYRTAFRIPPSKLQNQSSSSVHSLRNNRIKPTFARIRNNHRTERTVRHISDSLLCRIYSPPSRQLNLTYRLHSPPSRKLRLPYKSHISAGSPLNSPHKSQSPAKSQLNAQHK